MTKTKVLTAALLGLSLFAMTGCERDLFEDGEKPSFVKQDPEPEDTETSNAETSAEPQPEPVVVDSGVTTQAVAIAVDEIPLSNIVWLNTDVSKWEITSKLKVSLSGNTIVYDQDGTSKWPPASAIGGQMAGNAWIFAESGGVWYGATHEWMRPGQTTKTKSSVAGDHIKQYSYFPESWTPTPGARYGFMVSGLARDSSRNVEERTQITLMTWE